MNGLQTNDASGPLPRVALPSPPRSLRPPPRCLAPQGGGHAPTPTALALTHTLATHPPAARHGRGKRGQKCLLIGYEGSFGSHYLIPPGLIDGVVSFGKNCRPPSPILGGVRCARAPRGSLGALRVNERAGGAGGVRMCGACGRMEPRPRWEELQPKLPNPRKFAGTR